MKTLKQPLIYLIWIIIALLFGIGYMQIILGPNDVSSEGFGFLLHLFYNLGLLHIGLIIGGIIAVLFILFDIIYLKKKLKNNKNSICIRFLMLLLIGAFVGTAHYVLEKVIDVI